MSVSITLDPYSRIAPHPKFEAAEKINAGLRKALLVWPDRALFRSVAYAPQVLASEAHMRLFGNHKGPHLAHFRAHREHDHVELCWELRNAVGVRWRVLRSKRGFATEPRALPGNGQTVVMEGPETHLRDAEIGEGGSYYYTVFVQDAQGDWHRQAKAKLGHRKHLRRLRPSRAGSAFGTDLTGNVSQRGRDAAESLVLKHERGGRGDGIGPPSNLARHGHSQSRVDLLGGDRSDEGDRGPGPRALPFGVPLDAPPVPA